MRTIGNVSVWGEPVDVRAVEQIETCARDESVAGAALMADHHVGYSMPIGGVIAYRGKVSPSGVGYDIACGNKAVRLDMPGDEARKNIARIMDDVWESISFGMGRKNNETVEHELFDDNAWGLYPACDIKDKARAQLGTVGSGNHYVDVFVDELHRTWVGVHFGSRGLGHGIATHFMKAGGGRDEMFGPAVTFQANSSLGAEYIEQMRLAGEYAYAGRDWVCSRVAQLLGASIVEEVHNHHNFAWEEEHGGEKLWVVRKGATPAFPGQKGFVGGSMGDDSVILEGVEGPHSDEALHSTVHGAGRVMSRTQAAGKMRRQWVCSSRSCDWTAKGPKPNACPVCGNRKIRKMLVQLKRGEVTPSMMQEWVADKGVELRGAGTDESPHCYKRLPDVLREHAGSIRILHTLHPIGVAMAGPDVRDPFRD